GANHCALWQLVEVVVLVAYEGIGRVFPFADGNQAKAFREFHGYVFHGMNSQICTAVEHGFFQLLDEQPLAANLGQRNVQDLVALSFDFDQLDGDMAVKPFQLGLDKFCLPQCQGTAAGCDAKDTFGHGTHCRSEKCAPRLPCDRKKVPREAVLYLFCTPSGGGLMFLQPLTHMAGESASEGKASGQLSESKKALAVWTAAKCLNKASAHQRVLVNSQQMFGVSLFQLLQGVFTHGLASGVVQGYVFLVGLTVVNVGQI